MTEVQSSVQGKHVWLFSHCPLASFLPVFQVYFPLSQVLWVCTAGTGVLGWCPRNTTFSWFIWGYDKMLCSRCDERGRINFLSCVAYHVTFVFALKWSHLSKIELLFFIPYSTPLTLPFYCVMICTLPADVLTNSMKKNNLNFLAHRRTGLAQWWEAFPLSQRSWVRRSLSAKCRGNACLGYSFPRPHSCGSR